VQIKTNMADSEELDSDVEGNMKTSSSLQHMLAIITEERKRETLTFSISGGIYVEYILKQGSYGPINHYSVFF